MESTTEDALEALEDFLEATSPTRTGTTELIGDQHLILQLGGRCGQDLSNPPGQTRTGITETRQSLSAISEWLISP